MWLVELWSIQYTSVLYLSPKCAVFAPKVCCICPRLLYLPFDVRLCKQSIYKITNLWNLN